MESQLNLFNMQSEFTGQIFLWVCDFVCVVVRFVLACFIVFCFFFLLGSKEIEEKCQAASSLQTVNNSWHDLSISCYYIFFT